MNVLLRMKYSGSLQRPAAAWLVEGATTAEWLAELVAWQTPLAAARLFLVPTSPTDPTPCGVLVTGVARGGVSQMSSAAGSVVASPRTFAYGVAQRRLYLPIEAVWDPCVSAADVEAALVEVDDRTSDTLYLWHPRAGLISFAPSAALRVADLLAPAAATAERWDAAVPGVAISGRLTSLEPEHVPTASEVLDEARGDIGSEPLDADKMPPAPQEPTRGLPAAIRRAVDKKLAEGVMWLTGKLPGKAAEPTWINKLRDWAAGNLKGISQSLEAARNRELARLMNLLANDPDEGLRFALPMGGGEGRGVAAPSNVLGPRNVDFSLRGLGGGRPTDTWDVSEQMRHRLTQRYRELAAREIALGRHRRAAYIFAELLNDVQTAAVTLEDGRHWREAAALYEEKLRRPLEAARCLRHGGLRSEAIVLYRRLGEHEIVGDLYAELEQTEEARVAWREAVAAKLKAADPFGAARLLELKLNAADEAYDRLLGAWPHTKQAVLCLTEAFGLLARTERHDEAADLVAKLPQLHPTPTSAPSLAEILGAQGRDYPIDAVRNRAADQARVVAASRLTEPTLDQEEARRLTRVVGDLVPADRLLQRDGQRFLQQRRKPAPTGGRVGSKQSIVVVREIELPRGVEWKGAAATNDTIVAAGFRDRELVIVRTDWGGAEPEEPIGKKWIIDPSDVERPLLLSADLFDEGQTIVHLCGAESLQTTRMFRQSDRFPAMIGAGSHRGLSPRAYGICHSDHGTLHIVQDGGESLLVYAHAYEKTALMGFVGLELLRLPGSLEQCRLPLPIVAGEKGTYVGVGRNVCYVRSGSTTSIIETASMVTQLVGSAKGTRPRLAVAMEQGGFMLWDDDMHGKHTSFASEMIEPHIALTRDGSLVAAANGEIEVYSTQNGALKLSGRLTATGLTPLALLSTRQSNQFAILTLEGRLRYYSLSSY